MARRSDHTRDELRKLILETSAKIVQESGASDLTARRLAAEIGYAPGTIYNLFNSMDDLYLQINAQTLDRLYDTLNSPACLAPKKTPLQNMKKMAAAYMDFARKHRPFWLMLFLHDIPENRKNEDWYQEKIDRLFDPLENLLTPFFTARQRKKKRMAARALWSSVHGLCFLQETGKMRLADSDSDTATDMTAYLIETFIAGMERTGR